MNTPDLARWNLKYKQRSTTDVKSAEPELRHLVETLPHPGLALDLACGDGKDSIYLAQLGFAVIAVDGSIAGLRRCTEQSRRDALKVQPVVADLNHFSIATGAFDLIIMIRYLQRDLFQQIIVGLKPGGYVFIKTFNARFLALKPDFNPAYVLRDGELKSAFAALEIIDQSSDPNRTSSYLWARKCGNAIK